MNRRRSKRLVIAALIVLAALLTVDGVVGLWAFRTVLRVQSPATALVLPLDESSKAFLAERRIHWRSSEQEGPTISELLTAFEVVPSVQNLVQILTSAPPDYSWLSPLKNRRSLGLAGIRSMYMSFVPDATGQAIFVSEDEHLALLWLGPNGVILFEDETNSVRQTWYSRRIEK